MYFLSEIVRCISQIILQEGQALLFYELACSDRH